jgi:hypothetical protein
VSIRPRFLFVVSLAGLAGSVFAVAREPAADAATASALHECAAIAAATERLACFDRLAGQGVAPTTPSTSNQARASTAAPAASAAQRSSVTPPPSAAPATSGGTAATAAAVPKEAFGLYAVEHPAAPKPSAESITAKITALGVGANGRQTVSLEGGPLWELDGTDALLAKGDSVTIRRASFGSFLLTTPGGRVHRVQRLR